MTPFKTIAAAIRACEYFERDDWYDLIDDDCEITPQQISYGGICVVVFGKGFYTSMPKVTFCRALECFEITPGHDAPIGQPFKKGQNCSIGGEGFGYVTDSHGKHIRMPHLGRIIFGDNVHIHNNVNIDRGVTGDTVIGSGTKIDSLVHIAHNAQIGEDCLIVAGAIIGGSVTIGNGSFIGMGAKIKQKVKIGKGCTIGAGAVVICDVPDGETWAGVPAKKIIK